MTGIKLKVGGRYRNRSGEIVQIMDKRGFWTHTYVGSDFVDYRYNGRVGFFDAYDLDLVEETTESKPARIQEKALSEAFFLALNRPSDGYAIEEQVARWENFHHPEKKVA